MEQDFQIVDHDIEDDPDIHAPVRIGGEACDLEKSGIRQLLFEGLETGIKALDVADLEDTVVDGGSSRKVKGLSCIRRDRLLDQEMLSLL